MGSLAPTGACSAIIAADLGATAIILQKLPADTPAEARRTPIPCTSGMPYLVPEDAVAASNHLFALC